MFKICHRHYLQSLLVTVFFMLVSVFLIHACKSEKKPNILNTEAIPGVASLSVERAGSKKINLTFRLTGGTPNASVQCFYTTYSTASNPYTVVLPLVSVPFPLNYEGNATFQLKNMSCGSTTQTVQIVWQCQTSTMPFNSAVMTNSDPIFFNCT